MSQIIRTIFLFGLIIYIVSCAPPSLTGTRNSVVIDTNLTSTAKARIHFYDNRHFSDFRTEVNVELYADGKLKETIKDTNYSVMSWYGYYKDTIELVVHIGDGLNGSALLLKFAQDSILVYYYACGHTEDRKIYKLNTGDEFQQCVEVPPLEYTLSLSGIPDTIAKPIIYGHVDMLSDDFYRQDVREKLVKLRVGMRLYFRSQLRRYDL